MTIFDEKNRPGRDKAEGGFKFEKIGDQVGGKIIDMFEKPEQDGMNAQRCSTLESEDGKTLNVGLKRTEYMLSRTDKLQIGDELGVKYEKDVPSSKKGYAPAKSMTLFIKENGPRTSQNAASMSPERSDADKTFDAIGDDDAEGDSSPSDVPFE